MTQRLWLSVGLLLLTGPVAAAPPVLVPSTPDRVLVYSSQARVFRRAAVTLTGPSLTAGLADLPAGARPDSVRVECTSAEVQRVEIPRTREQLPRQVQARELAEKLEQALDRLRALREERELLDAELRLVGSLRLQRPTPRPEKAPPEGLFVDAWRRILSWLEARSGKAQARALELSGEEKKEQRAVHALLVKSKGLGLEQAGAAVPRVLVTLRGKPGRHQVTVSYLVDGVRWVPTYDLNYNPSSRSVEAVTYAMVSQSTGEDWKGAELRFSTGRPLDLVALPELPTWTLGRQRDFEPRPRPRVEPRPPVWRAEPPFLAAADLELERLRQAMAAATGVEASRPPEPKSLGELRGAVSQDEERPVTKRAKEEPAGFPLRPAAEPPRPGVATPSAVPPPPAPLETRAAEAGEVERTVSRASILAGRISAQPTDLVPWTDQGYRPPPVDPDSPAAAAEGYLYTLQAPGRHTIPGSGAPQRVPLARHRLSIRPLHRIRPGLSPAAYLTASLSNTTGKPILRGHANLFAGSMFTGRTWLNTALPGRRLLLPLGVDDAVQVVRHLHQRTATHGVLFKDDATHYTVAIEIANHHRYPVQVEVEDQVPVKRGDKVEVRGFSSASFNKPDHRGRVSWEGSVPASSVKKLDFSFEIVRPKDWELQQHDY